MRAWQSLKYTADPRNTRPSAAVVRKLVQTELVARAPEARRDGAAGQGRLPAPRRDWACGAFAAIARDDAPDHIGRGASTRCIDKMLARSRGANVVDRVTVLAALVSDGRVRYGTGTWPVRMGRAFRRLLLSSATGEHAPDTSPLGTGVILRRRGAQGESRERYERQGQAIPAGRVGRARRLRRARAGPVGDDGRTAREFWTAAMTRSRPPAQRGQGRAPTAKTRRNGAAHVQESGGEECRYDWGTS